MTPERWQQVERLYHSALEREPSRWAAYLEEACAGDDSLRMEVESLLAYEGRAETFIEAPALQVAAEALAGDRPIAVGERIGVYEILAPISAGGMGEVYRALDTALGREVAIKVLPAAFARDADRLRRFEQEARAAGMLNHPNILTIYAVGTHRGAPYLVSELLEGQTLRDRLGGAALTPRRTIEYAIQIAHGLAAAHEKGIVHRDLKPENIFVTKDGRVKILDFGLAKLIYPQSAMREPADGTLSGMVLGTAGYMAPEQVRGLAADHRADIFAFGAILYEMVSGRRAFQGASPVETMNEVAQAEPPDLSLINTQVTPALERVVRHCLEKSPEQRFQSARDLGFHLEALSATTSSPGMLPPPPSRRRQLRERIAWVIAGVVCVALIAGAVWLRRAEPTAPLVRFLLTPPENGVFGLLDQPITDYMAVSPDGRLLVFIATVGGRRMLWTRSLSALSASPLAGTNGATSPFWSPDSRFVAFFADGKLKKVNVGGGPPLALCNVTETVTTGTWGRKGIILFGELGAGRAGIYRVSSDGGEPSRVTTADPARSETWHFWPDFLPDGERFLFLAGVKAMGDTVYVASLNSSEVRPVLKTSSRMTFVAPNYLLYVQEGSLMVQRVSADLRAQGEPHAIAERVQYFQPTGYAIFSVSGNGVLAYQPGTSASRLTWFNKAGRELGTVGGFGVYESVRLSPDGQRVALAMNNARTGTNDIYTYELSRNIISRFTFDSGSAFGPVWSPDGRQIVFAAARGAPPYLHRKALNEAGAGVSLVAPTGGIQHPYDWSSDGRSIIYADTDPKTGYDLWVLPLAGDRKPVPFQRTSFNETMARFSPDGKWVAFVSDESGQLEVYVRPFAESGEKWRVSESGGSLPRWRRDGNELFYLAAGNKLMAAPVRTGATFEAGPSSVLFGIESAVWIDYDVAADGRFLISAGSGGPASTPFTVVLNWTQDLKP